MDKNYQKQIRNLLIVILIIACLWILKVTATLSIPLALAVFLFFSVSRLMSFMDKAKIPHFLTNLIILVLLAVVLFLMGTFAAQMTNNIMVKIPEYSTRFVQFDNWMTGFVYRNFGINLDTSFINALSVDWTTILKKGLTSVSSGIFDVSKMLMMVFLYLFFMMLERHSFPNKIKYAFREKGSKKVWLLIKRINKQISKYLGIKTIISLVTGFFIYIICLLFKIDFALFWGVSGFVLNYIPNLGSIFITVVIGLMAAVQYLPNWGPVIGVTAAITMSEMIIGNIIDPRVSGDKLDLSPFVILVSMSVWGYIWGIVGMFLAVPIMSIIQIICQNVESLMPIAILISNEKFKALPVEEPKES